MPNATRRAQRGHPPVPRGFAAEVLRLAAESQAAGATVEIVDGKAPARPSRAHAVALNLVVQVAALWLFVAAIWLPHPNVVATVAATTFVGNLVRLALAGRWRWRKAGHAWGIDEVRQLLARWGQSQYLGAVVVAGVVFTVRVVVAR